LESPTQKIIDFSIQSAYEDLPEEAVTVTKWYILDHIGNALGGYRTIRGKALVDLALDLGGKSESTLIGSGESTSCANATFAVAILMIN